MDHAVSLQSVLVLLASSVAAVALVSDREETRHLAEFGVVFLMFSIGLEFSLPKLIAMRRVVFGLGMLQVAATIAFAVGACMALGGAWQTGIALGGIIAMSSTAIVSKLLAERGELDSAHGRQVIGVLLFQDLAVVPLLVLIPALAQPPGALGLAVAAALGKAAIAL